MKSRMKMNGRKVPRKLALLGMSSMNMGLLQEKLKGVDVEPVSGSKCDVCENDSVSIFDYAMSLSLWSIRTAVQVYF